jgi:hypothetical protein
VHAGGGVWGASVSHEDVTAGSGGTTADAPKDNHAVQYRNSASKCIYFIEVPPHELRCFKLLLCINVNLT